VDTQTDRTSEMSQSKKGKRSGFDLVLTAMTVLLLLPVFASLLGGVVGGGVRHKDSVFLLLLATAGLISATSAIYFSAKGKYSSVRILIACGLSGLAAIPHSFIFLVGMLASGASVWAKFETKVTPLHKAVIGSAYKEAQDILARSPPLEAFTSHGRIPLSIAIRNSDTAMVRLLLKHGANPNISVYARSDAINDLRGPLILHAVDANSPEVVSLLLKNGASIRAVADWHVGNVMHVAMRRRAAIKKETKLSHARMNNELNRNNHVVSALIAAGFVQIYKEGCLPSVATTTYFKSHPELLEQQDVARLICN
jgi:ankyrin repeat protein